MTPSDLSAVIKGIAPVLREFVETKVGELAARVAAIEKRLPPEGWEPPAGPQGPEGPQGLPGEKGLDGKDAPPVTREQLTDAIKGLGLDAVIGTAVDTHLRAHPPAAGKDGVGLAGAVITREGALVVTLTDGTTRELGVIVGKDGAPGPAGRDGLDGAPGVDGLGFGDLHVEQVDERTFALRAIRGDHAKEVGVVTVPALIYRGVWEQGRSYDMQDVVTWGGSAWVALKATTEKPGDGVTSWRLMVKKGADGKQGPAGPSGPQGSRGEKGDPGPRVY